jgi:hypothetical protein
MNDTRVYVVVLLRQPRDFSKSGLCKVAIRLSVESGTSQGAQCLNEKFREIR